ncbi:hypothetical protein AGABI2DRAFT_135748 [Agaricus bisporus var. bisporus H97]|uniref:hypothetical protein n=1 Tax=Agaricus bisporus var. bisporus (strain H97 / ATCC MYA-4626 / FGSC 10389) TaxID=936046 RepID=UPI00029F55F2|nr:hypothetical protein AGABI2DRAFT_135748 [Agaricus bisporus var. bisporus H97]EKV48731.1 hypothetical protein AGABI2DRAFT_135748 [Agaricus bisporus var. bisporus H97]
MTVCDPCEGGIDKVVRGVRVGSEVVEEVESEEADEVVDVGLRVEELSVLVVDGCWGDWDGLMDVVPGFGVEGGGMLVDGDEDVVAGLEVV